MIHLTRGAIVGAVSVDWSSITPANVITWAVMLGGWVAFWVKLKDRVDSHSDMFIKLQKDTAMALIKQEEKLDQHVKVIEEIKIQGSPASRQSNIVMNSRIDSQNARLLRVEDAILEFKEIKVHVEWIKETLLNGNKPK